MLTPREATPEEAAQVYTPTPGYETWVAVLDSGEGLVGHLCVSRACGQVFGHDMQVDTEDTAGAIRLWRFAQKKVKEWGVTHVAVHFDDDTPERIKQLWIRYGFVKVMEIYRGEI